MFRSLFTVTLAHLGGVFLAFLPLAGQEDLQVFPEATLVPAGWADGDSFRVRLGPDREETFRLYFVDAPESTAARESDRRRLLEQSRHFGVPNPNVTLRHGLLAKERTAELLAEPFTVHTAFADAMGRSGHQRYYAFVTLADGRDLAEVLVGEGLARAFGVGRETPGGKSQETRRAFLADLELVAAVKRSGLWAYTDPDRLVELRETARQESDLMDRIGTLSTDVEGPDMEPLDLNRASHAELMLLPGVGPVLADRILDARPFASVEDLRRVSGIGAATMARIRPLVVVAK